MSVGFRVNGSRVLPALGPRFSTNGIAMDIFGSVPESPAALQRTLDTIAEQVASIDALVPLARQRIRVFDIDMSQMGWNSVRRTALIKTFLRSSRNAQLEIIVHDTRYLEAACPRLTGLLQHSSAGMKIARTGPAARSASDPLVIVDDRHFLHRFHIDQPRATLAIEAPALAQPLIRRFDEIWATAEAGLGMSVLGL